MYLSCGIFFPFYFFVKGILQKNILKTTLSTTILLLVILSLFFTFSYGAWIAVSLALAFTVIIFSKRKFLFSLFLVLIVAFAFLLQFDSEKFEALRNFSERSSFASRMMIWKTSLLMLKQSPILGIGPGNFQNTYLSLQKFFPPYLEWAVPQPHNIFLAFWLQSGIIGFAGFFLIVFHAIKNLLKIKGMDFSLHIPLVGFFFYTLLHGLVDTPFWKNDLAFLFWLNLFLAAAIWKIATKKPVSLETDRVQL
jgi:O-antigen ligase